MLKVGWRLIILCAFDCSAWFECTRRDAERMLIWPGVAPGSYIVRSRSGAQGTKLIYNILVQNTFTMFKHTHTLAHTFVLLSQTGVPSRTRCRCTTRTQRRSNTACATIAWKSELVTSTTWLTSAGSTASRSSSSITQVRAPAVHCIISILPYQYFATTQRAAMVCAVVWLGRVRTVTLPQSAFRSSKCLATWSLWRTVSAEETSAMFIAASTTAFSLWLSRGSKWV